MSAPDPHPADDLKSIILDDIKAILDAAGRLEGTPQFQSAALAELLHVVMEAHLRLMRRLIDRAKSGARDIEDGKRVVLAMLALIEKLAGLAVPGDAALSERVAAARDFAEVGVEESDDDLVIDHAPDDGFLESETRALWATVREARRLLAEATR